MTNILNTSEENLTTTTTTADETAKKIIDMMMIIIISMMDKWSETIGPRLWIVGSSFKSEGVPPIPEKFKKFLPEYKYGSTDVYDINSYFHELLTVGIAMSNTYYSEDQIIEKFEFLDTIKGAKEALDSITDSKMMSSLLTRERQEWAAARSSCNK
jgi:hypothetical protein